MSSAGSAPSSSYFKCEKTGEQLIFAVQGYPCLWDTSVDTYHIVGKTKFMGESGKTVWLSMTSCHCH